MFAVKGNKQYTIEAREKSAFIADGFDILDDSGNVIAEGAQAGLCRRTQSRAGGKQKAESGKCEAQIRTQTAYSGRN